MKTRVTIIDGIQYTIVIGQNRHENWRLLDDSDPRDVWFHANGASSAHAILYAPDTDVVPFSVVRFCAEQIGCNDVIYTCVSNLRKGKHTGEAIILDTKLITRLIRR
jgi:hypothetical protein